MRGVPRLDMVFAYVRDLVEGVTGERPDPDDDGDLPLRHEGALLFARAANRDDPVVSVSGYVDVGADGGSDRELEVLRAVNTLNVSLAMAKAALLEGQVVVRGEIWGSDVDPANFRFVCDAVAAGVRQLGESVALQGSLPFDAEEGAASGDSVGSGSPAETRRVGATPGRAGAAGNRQSEVDVPAPGLYL